VKNAWIQMRDQEHLRWQAQLHKDLNHMGYAITHKRAQRWRFRVKK